MATATDADTVFRVLEPFSFDLDGRTFAMRKGDIVPADHPSDPAGIRRRLFEEVNAAVAREHTMMRTQVSAVDALETATAAPGERRRMEVDHSIPADGALRDDGMVVTGSVPPGPSTPAPTGEPSPGPTPAPTPPPAPTPAPSGAETTADDVETADQPPRRSTGRGRGAKDQ